MSRTAILSPIADLSVRSRTVVFYLLPLLLTMSSLLVEEMKRKVVEREMQRRSLPSDLAFLPAMHSADDILAFARKQQATMADFTFVDVPGTLQHTTKPIHDLEEVLASGAGFDGSSIRGFQAIEESDMLLRPDPSTAFLDTFSGEPTIALLCDVHDPVSDELYDASPRTIARRAEEELKRSGIADTAYFGPEAEFFIFDSVRYDQSSHQAFYEVDSEEAIWNTSRREEGGNQGYKIRHKEGYFPGAPMDRMKGIRGAMVRELELAGIRVETSHHEVATAGQGEIDMMRDSLVKMADKLIRYKYILRNVAHRYGKTVTFMPKPLYGDNGSGMHVHQSLWKDGKPLFAGEMYAGLSSMALHYIGGILHHAPALAALCNPTTNSYKRLVPGFEAPVNLIYSARNRSAAIRIPMYSSSAKAKRIEFRMPDASCNPYLAFSAMLLAGLDGIERGLQPGAHTDENLYSMASEKLAQIPHAPESLSRALDALEEDHAFLTKSGVFSETFLANYIAGKRVEIAEGKMRPTPWEFYRYFDV